MNVYERNNVFDYLITNGITSIDEFDDTLIDYPISHQSLILSIANILKQKTLLETKHLSNDIYNEYITLDNQRIVQSLKHLIRIYHRNLRTRRLHYYLQWKLNMLEVRPQMGNSKSVSKEQFAYIMKQEGVHDRLFNDYKVKEEALNRLENLYSFNEAVRCPFIPFINHNYSMTNIGRPGILSNKIKQFINDTYTHKTPKEIQEKKTKARCKNDIEKETEKEKERDRSAYITTNSTSHRLYSPMSINSTNDLNNLTKQQYQLPNTARIQSMKPSNPRSYSNRIEEPTKSNSNAEMKYVMKYLSNQSSSKSLLFSKRGNKSSTASSNTNLIALNTYSNIWKKTPKISQVQLPKQLYNETTTNNEQHDNRISESSLVKHTVKDNYKDNPSQKQSVNNIIDKQSHYVSHENPSKQLGSSLGKLVNQTKSHEKTNSDLTKAFLYTYKTNTTQSYDTSNQEQTDSHRYYNRKKHPLILTKQYETENYIQDSQKDYQLSENGAIGICKTQQNVIYNKGKIDSMSNMNHFNQTSKSKSNEKNIPKKNNKALQITSGINEFFAETYRTINKNETQRLATSSNKNANQITLQSMSDSKLYEVANHYITTDESLDRYKCLTNRHRKFPKQ